MSVRASRWLAVGFAALLLAGCDATTSSEGEPELCGLRARLDGSWYVSSGGVRVIPSYGDALGKATVPPCGGEGGYSFEAFSIVGVRPEVAFASPRYEDLVFIAEATQTAPRWLQRLRVEPTCAEQDEPIALQGPWLGIIGPHHETEVDLVPPYTLEMRVDEASSRRYERTLLTIRVADEAGRLVTPQDVRTSLQQGGNLSVRAVCRNGEFSAKHVAALPPS